MQMRWNFEPADATKVDHLQQSLKIDRVLCQLLVKRGIETFEQARDFFRPSLDHLHDPYLMKDMDKAVARIQTAIQRGEKILIYGDYDVDGTTAVATVYSFLKTFYDAVDFYVPHRYREGYGISTQGIDYAADHGYTLIIALDCGIKSVDKVTYANERHIDFIIADHHLPGAQLPDAVAVLDPKRNDCPYPYKELCGCGIGFKLIQALAQAYDIPEENYLKYLDLVCLAIGADIVPITGENRVLAYMGLQKINTNPGPGIKQLMEVSGIKASMTVDDVVFMIAPRINAAGRMDDARQAVQLLISEQVDPTAVEQAYQLHRLNADRKELDKTITEHALGMIAADSTQLQRKSTVLCHESWNKGVLGIVASRLTENHYRPTIVLTESEGILTGSARSVKGFDLYEAIYKCRDLLIQFGGHKYAAGLTLKRENLEAFAQQFDKVVRASITEEQLIPALEVDAIIEPEIVSPSFYNIIQEMAPFGPGNMKPLFVTQNLTDTGWSRVLKDAHIKFSVRKQGSAVYDGIGFSMADKFPLVKNGAFDLAYHIDENEWNGQKRLQWMVKDVQSTKQV
ncbi:MAG: single-stranded-DNA-specific exonuclease RecJ [Bacteroidetes bacterium]|nr:single-stranded-DNA-specific exonuclease RecJ [Bacteroidota bacterium]